MKKNRLAKILVLFTAILAGLLVLLVFLSQPGKETGNVTFDKVPPIDGQPVLGDPEAEVTIIKFGDYKCPACKTWHQSIFPQLKESYIDKRLANFVFINTMFQGEESTLASLAAESVWAQDEEAFWIYHDELFNSQPDETHPTPWVTVELLLDIADTHTPEIDLTQLEEDINQHAYISQLEADMRLVREYEIQLTPSIMINNVLLEDPFDVEAIQNLIETQLGEEQP